MSGDKCWKLIGTEGDRSCARLEGVKHCRNCVDYLNAGRQLFERPIPAAYMAECTRVVAQEKAPSAAYAFALLVFQLSAGWYGVLTKAVQAILPATVVHAVPHRTNAVFHGVTNVDGELLPCCCGRALLREGDDISFGTEKSRPNRRCIVLAIDDQRFALAVDAVDAVVRVAESDLKPAPATLLRAADALTYAVLRHNGRDVGVLHTERLGRALAKSLEEA